MRHKDVIEIYNSIIKQITNKIGKEVDIVYPHGSKNVIVPKLKVSPNMYAMLVNRRKHLLGGTE